MLFFVRHGQTNDNLNHIISGCKRDVKLNKTGMKQVKQMAQELKNVTFDICYCSPLIRAKQTAKEILKFHQNVTMIVDDRLKERDFGEIEGVEDVSNVIYTEIWDKKIDKRANGMESIDEAFARVSSFYDEIIKRHSNKENILIVAHNGIARLTCCYFYGFPQSGDLNFYDVDNSDVKTFDLVHLNLVDE